MRPDKRKTDELRPIKIQAGVLSRADGSAYIEWGQNKALVAVYGPREALPKHTQNPFKANINYHYRMASFSVPDRKNPRPGRREMEISKVSQEALEKAVFTERFPNSKIDIYVHFFDMNAGSRVTALTAASVALANAGIPMRDLVSAVSVGRANKELIVDLTKEEEDAEDAVDIPIAMLPRSGEIVLLQMDGVFEKKELEKAIELAKKPIQRIYEIQKEALKNSCNANIEGEVDEQ